MSLQSNNTNTAKALQQIGKTQSVSDVDEQIAVIQSRQPQNKGKQVQNTQVNKVDIPDHKKNLSNISDAFTNVESLFEGNFNSLVEHDIIKHDQQENPLQKNDPNNAPIRKISRPKSQNDNIDNQSSQSSQTDPLYQKANDKRLDNQSEKSGSDVRYKVDIDGHIIYPEKSKVDDKKQNIQQINRHQQQDESESDDVRYQVDNLGQKIQNSHQRNDTFALQDEVLNDPDFLEPEQQVVREDLNNPNIIQGKAFTVDALRAYAKSQGTDLNANNGGDVQDEPIVQQVQNQKPEVKQNIINIDDNQSQHTTDVESLFDNKQNKNIKQPSSPSLPESKNQQQNIQNQGNLVRQSSQQSDEDINPQNNITHGRSKSEDLASMMEMYKKPDDVQSESSQNTMNITKGMYDPPANKDDNSSVSSVDPHQVQIFNDIKARAKVNNDDNSSVSSIDKHQVQILNEIQKNKIQPKKNDDDNSSVDSFQVELLNQIQKKV
jgi:hypothetical protein